MFVTLTTRAGRAVVGVGLLLQLAMGGPGVRPVAAELLWLDTRGTAVTTTFELDSETWYGITVKGTYSAWTAATWGNPCGTPEAAPQFPSDGVANGPVGHDAEVWFAAAACGATDPICCCNTPCPHHYSYFWMNLDGTWEHIEPIDGIPQTPNEEHSYSYRVLGRGHRASFLNYDDVYSDNYGVLRIEVEALATGTSAWNPERGMLVLGAPFPNPTSAGAQLAFWTGAAGFAAADVFDCAGRRVHSVVWRALAPGEHSFTWDGKTSDGTTVPAGVYFVRLHCSGGSRTGRMVVLR